MRRNQLSDEEYWAYVPNFPEYIVSNFGHIKRAGNRGRPLTKDLNDEGHLIVSLHIGQSIPRHFRLDRIVAAAFLGAFGHEMMVIDIDHIDGDPHNCRADNLEWSSRV